MSEDNMDENKKTLPEFASVEEFVEFFDNNDMGEYMESMPETEFDLSRGRAAWQKRRNLVAIEASVMEKVRDRAKAEQTSAQALINAWLEEKILQPA